MLPLTLVLCDGFSIHIVEFGFPASCSSEKPRILPARHLSAWMISLATRIQSAAGDEKGWSAISQESFSPAS